MEGANLCIIYFERSVVRKVECDVLKCVGSWVADGQLECWSRDVSVWMECTLEKGLYVFA